MAFALMALAAAARICGTPMEARRQPTPLTPARTESRPHLLLSETDPFTSLAALRARYAAGLRPGTDVCGNAVTWLITGEAAAADRAVAQLREPGPARANAGAYPAIVCRALAFDWLSAYPGFDIPLKDRIATDLADAAERMLQDASLKDPASVSYQNYPVRYLALASFAAAAAARHPLTADRVAPLNSRLRQSFDNVLETAEFLTPDGGFHESMDYMRITMAAMVLMAELRRTTDGTDPAWKYGVFRNISQTYLYKVLADGSSSREGDDEYPLREANDNLVLAYAVSRFKDPFAAWMLRDSGWSKSSSRLPTVEFLWNDPLVRARDPRQADISELPRHRWFHGIDHIVLRDGWTPDSTWIQLLSGPFAAKHQHLDRNAFTIFHGGALAIDSGADYTATESPHYLNYFRRTVAHNTLLVYQPGEKAFWGEDLWPAANDGGQRMDSSRFWNTIRSVDDWQRTRDLWDAAHVDAASFHDGQYQFVRSDATDAYARSKVTHFTRELLYLPSRGLVTVYDHIRSPSPAFRKVWLLHGVGRPEVQTDESARDVGHGGTSYGSASTITWTDGTGQLRVHPLLPLSHDVVVRGGDGWEFWTPGDERGGDWGSGQNWPLDPAEGGPLPDDPYLLRMWRTFWPGITRIARSNRAGVIPGAWRMEVTGTSPTADERFLHVLEIGDRMSPARRTIQALDAARLSGALVDDLLVLCSRDETALADGEISVPDGRAVREVYATGLRPVTTYELQWTSLGIPGGRGSARTDEAGVLHLAPSGAAERLRLRVVGAP